MPMQNTESTLNYDAQGITSEVLAYLPPVQLSCINPVLFSLPQGLARSTWLPQQGARAPRHLKWKMPVTKVAQIVPG